MSICRCGAGNYWPSVLRNIIQVWAVTRPFQRCTHSPILTSAVPLPGAPCGVWAQECSRKEGEVSVAVCTFEGEALADLAGAGPGERAVASGDSRRDCPRGHLASSAVRRPVSLVFCLSALFVLPAVFTVETHTHTQYTHIHTLCKRRGKQRWLFITEKPSMFSEEVISFLLQTAKQVIWALHRLAVKVREDQALELAVCGFRVCRWWEVSPGRGHAVCRPWAQSGPRVISFYLRNALWQSGKLRLSRIKSLVPRSMSSEWVIELEGNTVKKFQKTVCCPLILK